MQSLYPTATAPADDLQTEIVRNPAGQIRSQTNQTACLVQIYPANHGLGRRHLLNQPLTLGRELACEVTLDEPSISRYHARLVPKEDGYYLADLRSTNGTFVNDSPVSVRKLEDGDHVRLGNHIFRFLDGGNIEADYHEEIFRLTITDALTGAYNKRHLLDFLDRELTRSCRHGRPLSLVMMDIDHFKDINDRYGHLAGDAILRGIAERMRADIRRDELFARYGGEEFAIVLPETSVEGAQWMGERMRLLVAAQPFTYQHMELPVTISVGAAATEGGEHLSPSEFIDRADVKLYQAKHLGRNLVAV